MYMDVDDVCAILGVSKTYAYSLKMCIRDSMNLGLNNVISLQVYGDHCEELKKEISRYAA